jgi:MoaA/NifB/PqqE/SkfB family radical SAM enzyme
MKTKKAETLHVSVGYTCNNACLFCMESDKELRRQLVQNFIKTDHMYHEMDEHQNIKKIGFGRGEPTLNPELPKYIAYAKKKGFLEIAVISNGRQYKDKEFCRKLMESGVTEFIVSLHGHTPKLHEALTQRKKSFLETTQGLKNLSELRRDFKFRIIISHVVTKVNYKFIGNFLKLMQNFSIDEILLGVVRPYNCGGMKNFFFALMPRYGAVAKKMEQLIEKNRELFFSKEDTNKQYVTINDIPLCSSRRLIELMGNRRAWVSGNDVKGEEYEDELPKCKEVKCQSCLCKKNCGGIFKSYTDHYGWDEFEPITK